MDIFYISSACSEQTLKEVSNKYMDGVPLKAPQQTFDLSVAFGLKQQTNVDFISLPPVPSFPKSKCIYFPRKVEKVKENLNIEYIPVINLPIIKTVCILFFVLYKILIWSKNSNAKKKFILLHWPYYPTMLAAYIAKKFTKHKVILTVPDLPSYSAMYNNSLNLITKIRTCTNKIKPNLISKFDGYVLLTKYMAKKLKIMDKPYTILEGLIRDEDILQENTLENKYPVKVIMYAGAVYEKFGLKKLVKAFNQYVHINCELWLYGSGDFVKEIKEYEHKDGRIKYKGIKFRQDILDAEKKATLLVNPRPTNEEFTKYSFPSKTLEYMASGTPIASTRLAGIPNEYKEYVYWLEDETIWGLGKKINEIMTKDTKELHRFGVNSQKWVASNKNYLIQTKKIICLLKGI